MGRSGDISWDGDDVCQGGQFGAGGFKGVGTASVYD